MNMRVLRRGCCAVAVLLLPCLCLGQEYLFFEPRTSTGEDVSTSPGKGVLVKRVTVKNGDTLKSIARKYIGRDWLFPQVLLFNKVKNPDSIHPGETLLVPVRGKDTGGRRSSSGKKHRSTERKPVSEGNSEAGRTAPAQGVECQPAVGKPAKQKSQKELPPTPMRASEATGGIIGNGNALYQSARKAYIQGDYRKAADLFTAFLGKHATSPLAADAALYRADAFLHLSEQ